MTFLRKRSRSQCSTSTYDDEFTISRKQSKDIQRHSGMSSNTQVTARDYDVHDSCVYCYPWPDLSLQLIHESRLRNFPRHKSAHLRFLAWVQYTRQFPEYSITEDERRTCPLLWCRAAFQTEEAMLKHVWNCEHLSKGLYWCFQCQKPERVGKFQCRRCQGGSSTTDRIATVAKKMFSALGTKNRAEKSVNPGIRERGLALSKISEASEVCQSWNSGRFSEEGLTRESQSYLDPPYMPELPNNYVSEMENTCVISELSGGWNDLSQELPASRNSRSNSRISSTESPVKTPSVEGSSYQASTMFGDLRFESPRPTRSILPRLNTNTSFDVPTKIYQTNAAYEFADHLMSATIVSPLSPTGGFDFGASDALEVSPTDSVISGKSLFTDSGYSSSTLESSWNGSDSDVNITAEVRRGVRTKTVKHFDSSNTEKFLGWHSKSTDPLIFPTISEVTQVYPMTSFSSNVNPIHSAGRCNVPEKSRSLSPHWSDAQSLVKSFSEVLNEHFQHSRSALKEMASNSITRDLLELLSLSPSSIISIGFGVLAGLLEGRRPTAVIPLFAFTHIAYALAISVDNDSSKIDSPEWFQDSLSLLEDLASDRQRQTYTQIVRVIWQPRVSLSPVDRFSSILTSCLREESENRLIKACKHFLDSELRSIRIS